MAAEAAGTAVDKIEDRILISPLAINEGQTAAVLTYTQEVDVKTKEKDDGDEHINRLVQEVIEDSKSVRSFGERTDIDAINQEEGQDKIRVGQVGPLKMAIKRYVGDYEALWPALLEPDLEFKVDDGQIPCPLDLGNLGRRMVSVM